MKFKVGQRVRCIEGLGASGTGWELGRVFIIKRAEIYKPWDNASRYYDKNDIYVFEDHLELANKTIEDVDYPDIIENERNKCKVLARINDLVFFSANNEFDETCGYLTIVELKEYNYKPVDNEPEKEKMITIKGKEYSEDTIHKSLKEYVK